MKKIISLLLITTITLSLSACAYNGKESQTLDEPAVNNEPIISESIEETYDEEVQNDEEQSHNQWLAEEIMKNDSLDNPESAMDIAIRSVDRQVFGENPTGTDVTFPAYMSVVFELEPGDDLTKFIEEMNFVDAKWNEDGSITCTATEEGYQEMKDVLKNFKSYIK